MPSLPRWNGRRSSKGPFQSKQHGQKQGVIFHAHQGSPLVVKGLFCALPVSLALAVLVLGGVRLYVEHATYPAYLETAGRGPGSVGTAPLEDTPWPASLAEIQQCSRFPGGAPLQGPCPAGRR